MDPDEVIHSPHSEASKLLEAALEQMDGIIQVIKPMMYNYINSLIITFL